MLASALAVLLSSAPAGVFFYSDGGALYRAQLSGASPSSGPVQVHADVVKLPGVLVGHSPSPRGADLAIACPNAPLPNDLVRGCDVYLVDRDGRVVPLGVSALSASFVGEDRFAYWTDGLELRVRALSGGESEVVASQVLEPRVGRDGTSFGVALAPGLSRFEPGAASCPGVVRFGRVEKVNGPCEAQAPFVSKTGKLAYVSTEDGVASFRVGTAASVRRVGPKVPANSPAFIPVAGGELVWVDGARAIYAAHYSDETLWSLDVDAARATPLGRGREPAMVCDAEGRCAIYAADGHGSSTRVWRVAEVSR